LGIGEELGAQFDHNCAYGREIGLALGGHLYAREAVSKGSGAPDRRNRRLLSGSTLRYAAA
jgi:hypothetical protein